MDSPPYHVDIAGLDDGEPPMDSTLDDGSQTASSDRRTTAIRPWVGVRFECCGVYSRVYRNAEGTAYLGRCPRCTRGIRLTVGPGGTSSRFFVAE